MLTDLLIKNYALIEQLKLKPHESLNIITGETGAGKSIMLGAIGLLLGNRADLKVLFDTESKCVVEASFLIWAYHLKSEFEALDVDYEDHTTVRREILPSGKSRAFINDTPVTLDTLRKIVPRLIDIHSQHDNLLLGDQIFQLYVVDSYAGNQELLSKYATLYKDYTSLKQQYNRLQQDYETTKKEHDYNVFLLEELQKANLQADEQESLENELQLLERAEEVKLKLNQITDFLSLSETAVNDQLRGMVNSLGQIADLSEDFANLHQRLDSCLIELQDISAELQREEEKVEFDPGRIEEVQGRVSMMYNLQQKHQVSSNAALLEIQADLEEKVAQVLNFDGDIAQLKANLESAYEALVAQANLLTDVRTQNIPVIQDTLKALLGDLGMPQATVEIQREGIEPSPEGMDKINFLFSANKGIPPQEISKVASGGEFSRLMLSIKYILADKTALPTIIFDEIDTGISGEIAIKMGNMFKTMALKHQIIAISHLHQIAAKGNHHYFVYKDDSRERTISRIRQLSDEERIFQIAQMIGGSQPSESALLSAKEMLEES